MEIPFYRNQKESSCIPPFLWRIPLVTASRSRVVVSRTTTPLVCWQKVSLKSFVLTSWIPCPSDRNATLNENQLKGA